MGEDQVTMDITEPDIGSVELITFFEESGQISFVFIYWSNCGLFSQKVHEQVSFSVFRVGDRHKFLVFVIGKVAVVSSFDVDAKPGSVGLEVNATCDIIEMDSER